MMYYIREGEHVPPMPYLGTVERFGHTVVKCATDEGEHDGWQRLTLAELQDWENGRDE